ncbi:MAG: gliding motility-associated C-terminal domain-containing protein [Oligoflexus sp.]|nr:gliding motility-associated C-terminal domain-containing protein [Pseudopedobacter sp.]
MKFLLLLSFVFLFGNYSMAADETITSGSFIINLGVVPQTIQNGLKPYGLVYDMLKNYKVPIKWVINQTKERDDVDFILNGTSYRGGAFIILTKYRTKEVNDVINSWLAKGIVGETSTTDFKVNIYSTLSYAPRWTIDKTAGDLVTPFFVNAGIPPDAHGGEFRTNWKNPSQLTVCDDIFVLPHADPSFATHKNLLAWNRDFKGAIWAGCHAVSVLENISLNFLTTTGMVSYQSHPPNGVVPFTYSIPGNPVMQFIGSQDGASQNGSEATYLPKIGSQWNAKAILLIKDTKHPSIPRLSSGPAASVVLGRGFDDDTRGWVMYQGGHFHNGSANSSSAFGGAPFGPDHVALQRAFFNFSLMSIADKQGSVAPNIIAPKGMLSGTDYPITFELPAGKNINDYKIEWFTSSGFIKTDPTKKEIQFEPPAGSKTEVVLISLVLTDDCGRQYFSTLSLNVTCLPPAIPPVIDIESNLLDDKLTYTIGFKLDYDKDGFSKQWKVSSGEIIGASNQNQITFKPSTSASNTLLTITLTLVDNCQNVIEVSKTVRVNHVILNNGKITAVKLVSANSDGNGHDYLFIENLQLYINNKVSIFNRWGNEIKLFERYDNENIIFDGRGKNGQPVPDGVYYYMIEINDPNYSTEVSYIKGFFVLKR